MTALLLGLPTLASAQLPGEPIAPADREAFTGAWKSAFAELAVTSKRDVIRVAAAR